MYLAYLDDQYFNSDNLIRFKYGLQDDKFLNIDSSIYFEK